METATAINNLKVSTSNRQILSIALPITLAILIPQINMLTNSIFLGRLSEEALGNAGVTGVFYLIFAVAGNGLNNAMQTVFSKHAGAGNRYQPAVFPGLYFIYMAHCATDHGKGCRPCCLPAGNGIFKDQGL